ncbi:hypothetical protein FGB62_218g014 [Gracilaria domingensis]|nr:hypothetical protein FGB62_218g014 [Gracilaria domingensis]
MLQKACTSSRVVYVDDYLFAFIRLVAETSKRVQFLLNRRDKGLPLEKYLDCVKEVLGGSVTTLEYDEFCEKMFDGTEDWEEHLCDFPLICKRLTEAALSIPWRTPASELLELARTSLGINNSNGSEGKAQDKTAAVKGRRKDEDDGDHVMEDVDPTMSASTTFSTDTNRIEISESEKRLKTLQQARQWVNNSGGYLFGLKVSRVTDTDMGMEHTTTKTLRITFRLVTKHDACQFRTLNLADDSKEKKVESTLTKYLKRARKRKRCMDFDNVDRGADEVEVYVVNNLDVRINEDTGDLTYVSGTEDFLMNRNFKRRKVLCKVKRPFASDKTEAVAVPVS